jgi:endonuclease/exonuclease/phosphatase family metal-dependent hydrolase
MKKTCKSLIIHANRTVTFHYENSTAQRVSVAGFFNDWQLAALAKNRQGIWEYTTPALLAGTYAYVFHVDGKPTHDPGNPRINHARSGWQSVFDIAAGDYPAPTRRASSLSRARPGSELVVVTLNTHSLQEKTGRFAKLADIANELAHVNADIIGLNEIVYGKIYTRGYDGCYYDTARMIQQQMESATGTRFYLYRLGFAQWQDGEHLGNAILCKYPLYDTMFTKLTTRDFWPAPQWRRMCIGAQVNMQGQRCLNVFVTHTMGYDLSDTPLQVAEIQKLVCARQTAKVAGSLVMGDFNVPYGHRYHTLLLQGPASFLDLWAMAKPEAKAVATTVDGKPRIDYVFWAGGACADTPQILDATLLFDGKTSGDRVSPLVSDHFGVLVRLRLPSFG